MEHHKGYLSSYQAGIFRGDHYSRSIYLDYGRSGNILFLILLVRFPKFITWMVWN